jgi:hypothetical protein
MGARIKAALGLAAAGIFASVLVPAPANAIEYNFIFCNIQGNIPNPVDEYVDFPYRGISSPVLSSGDRCWPTHLSGLDNDLAVGYRRVNGQWLAVATVYFRDSDGSRIDF